MSYETLASLPDFSGWWYFDLTPDQYDALRAHIRFKPQAAAFINRLRTGTQAGKIPDLGAQEGKSAYCGPARFDSRTGGFADEVEFLFTPGRVTITDERGLVRRITLSDGPPPADPDESDSGTSVGQWEGQTLVVETVGLNSQTPIAGPFKLGHGARVLERFSLEGPDELKIVSRLTAPDVLAAPAESTFRFHRDRRHVFHEEVTCVEDDRSIDPTTGRQRFDMTPPKDLPPPPPG